MELIDNMNWLCYSDIPLNINDTHELLVLYYEAKYKIIEPLLNVKWESS